MDSQDSRFTTPPPYYGEYGNLYDADTPPSAQPRSPPLSLPDSQKTTQSWDSRNGPRPQIDESQPSPPLFIPDSQADSSQELSQGTNRHYICAPETSRNKRLQIQIALLFRIPYAEIKERLDITDFQIKYTRNHCLTPQKACYIIKLYIPEKTTLKVLLLSSPSHCYVAYHKISHYLL